MLARGLDQRKLFYAGPVSTGMGDPVRGLTHQDL